MSSNNQNVQQNKYQDLKTAEIIAETLLDWGVDTIFGLPGDGINGFIEALRTRQDKIRFILVILHLWHVLTQSILED